VCFLVGVFNCLVIILDDLVFVLLYRVGLVDLFVIGIYGYGCLVGFIVGFVSWVILDKMICDVMLV